VTQITLPVCIATFVTPSNELQGTLRNLRQARTLPRSHSCQSSQSTPAAAVQRPCGSIKLMLSAITPAAFADSNVKEAHLLSIRVSWRTLWISSSRYSHQSGNVLPRNFPLGVAEGLLSGVAEDLDCVGFVRRSRSLR